MGRRAPRALALSARAADGHRRPRGVVDRHVPAIAAGDDARLRLRHGHRAAHRHALPRRPRGGPATLGPALRPPRPPPRAADRPGRVRRRGDGVRLRAEQALGAGSGPVIARAVVRDLYEPERAARVLAAMGTAQALTPILAPMLGGWVHVLAGWRAVFVVLGAFGAAFLVTAWRIVPETNVYAGARGAGEGGGLAALLRHPRFAAYVAAAALMFSGQFAFITGSSFALITILGVSPTVYGLCFGAVAVGLMAGNFVSVRLGPRLGIDAMIGGGTMIGAAAGVVMAALAWAGVASVATVIAPMFCYAFGLGWVLPNAMAGAIGPFPRMAGLAAAGAGFVQLTGSALYAIAVSHTYDGTLRPMTTAVATAGIAALVTFALLRRGRVVLDSTERRRP